MKTVIQFKTLLFLLFLPGMIIANNSGNWDGKHTKEKTIKKEFPVNKDALLKINNSYGNITIVTTTGNTATIDVLIKTNGDNEDKVQEKLDDIDVDFSASKSEVSAKTIFNKRNSKSWWNWNKNNRVNMQINYRISIPVTNSVNLNNDYGSITLDRLEGKATIHCDYGKITTKELMGTDNSLSFDYTNNSYFEYINGGRINADYSEFTVAKSKSLDINADYTKSKVEVGENLVYNCDYGSLKVENINNLKGMGDYLSTEIGNVYGNLEVDQDYGSIRIIELTPNAGNVSIKASYAGIEIGYNAGYNFNFDIDLTHASLRNSDDFKFTKSVEKSSDKEYSGTYGSGGNQLKIDSDYGSVTFKKKS